LFNQSQPQDRIKFDKTLKQIQLKIAVPIDLGQNDTRRTSNINVKSVNSSLFTVTRGASTGVFQNKVMGGKGLSSNRTAAFAKLQAPSLSSKNTSMNYKTLSGILEDGT